MHVANCTFDDKVAFKTFEAMCEHFVEHGTVRRRGHVGLLSVPFGRVLLVADKCHLVLRARADTDTMLAYLKLGALEHLREFTGNRTLSLDWSGAASPQAVRSSLFRRMRVIDAFDLTPTMRRVVLSGEDLAGFATGGIHVRLLFPPDGRDGVWPEETDSGSLVWPSGPDAPVARVYTIRLIDLSRSEVIIDILRHDGDRTPGSRFAATAQAGDLVGMVGPLGESAELPTNLFMFGDETAIPAIARILRPLPENAKAQVTIEVAGPWEEQQFETRAALEVHWLHREKSVRSLGEAAHDLDVDALGSNGFVWAGCEFSDFKQIRQHCRERLRLPPARHRIVCYWRREDKPNRKLI